MVKNSHVFLRVGVVGSHGFRVHRCGKKLEDDGKQAGKASTMAELSICRILPQGPPFSLGCLGPHRELPVPLTRLQAVWRCF